MVTAWKLTITIFLLYLTVIDASRVRRRRQAGSNPQSANQNAPSNTFNAQTDARQQQLPPNPQVLNPQGYPQQQINQGGVLPKDMNSGLGQAGRQLGYGSQGSNYNQYSGGGSQYGGAGQYGQYGQGTGQYGQGMGQYGQGMGQYGQGMGQYGQGMGQYGQGMGQYGQGMGQYGQGMGQYGGYNQNSGYNNRPGYSSNYNPSSGNSYGGGYFWNAGQKQNVNMLTIFLSSLLTLAICWIAI